MANGTNHGRAAHTAPHRLAARHRFEQAIELRTQGYTFRAIGERLGMRPGHVHTGMMRLLKEATVEHAEALRAIEGERLDALQAALWPDAMAGDVRAALACVRIIEARARLFGLDAPARAPVDAAGKAVPPQVTIVYEAFPGGPLLPSPPEWE